MKNYLIQKCFFCSRKVDFFCEKTFGRRWIDDWGGMAATLAVPGHGCKLCHGRTRINVGWLHSGEPCRACLSRGYTIRRQRKCLLCGASGEERERGMNTHTHTLTHTRTHPCVSFSQPSAARLCMDVRCALCSARCFTLPLHFVQGMHVTL
jgi:hypothetical protein